MAHFAKYSRAACGGVSDHCERRLKENGEHRDYGNEDIDLSRTDENYNLAKSLFSQKRDLKNQKIFPPSKESPERNAMSLWWVKGKALEGWVRF